MQVSISGNEFLVKPDSIEAKEALNAINSMRSPDELVTYALRRHGYGNDGWSVTYANDQDEIEKDEKIIPEGYIEICCVGSGNNSGPLIKESIYIELLAHVCELSGLTDRAKLLHQFIENPTVADGLLEASAKRCNERWKRFAPFLEKNGWKLVGNEGACLGEKVIFNIEHCTSDLDVKYRDTKRNLSKNKNALKEWIDHQNSMINALEEFFEFEETKI